jgi:hypothetical protein
MPRSAFPNKLNLTLTPNGGRCTVAACSESQVTSVVEFRRRKIDWMKFRTRYFIRGF